MIQSHVRIFYKTLRIAFCYLAVSCPFILSTNASFLSKEEIECCRMVARIYGHEKITLTTVEDLSLILGDIFYDPDNKQEGKTCELRDMWKGTPNGESISSTSVCFFDDGEIERAQKVAWIFEVDKASRTTLAKLDTALDEFFSDPCIEREEEAYNFSVGWKTTPDGEYTSSVGFTNDMMSNILPYLDLKDLVIVMLCSKNLSLLAKKIIEDFGYESNMGNILRHSSLCETLIRNPRVLFTARGEYINIPLNIKFLGSFQRDEYSLKKDFDTLVDFTSRYSEKITSLDICLRIPMTRDINQIFQKISTKHPELVSFKFVLWYSNIENLNLFGLTFPSLENFELQLGSVRPRSSEWHSSVLEKIGAVLNDDMFPSLKEIKITG